jgi:ribonuclease E
VAAPEVTASADKEIPATVASAEIETGADAGTPTQAKPAAEKASKPVSKPVAKTPASETTAIKPRPVGRASNDPRVAPQPLKALEIVTAQPQTPKLDPSIIAQPSPNRPAAPRAANDPRN